MIRFNVLDQPFRAAGQACGGFIVLVGLLAASGWLAGIRVLASVRDGSIPMAPNTALAFVFLGINLLLAPLDRKSVHRLTVPLASAVLAVTLFRLVEYLSGRALGVDGWFFRAPAETLGLAPVGQMSFFTAATLFMAGVSSLLVMKRARTRLTEGMGSFFAVIVLFVGLTFLLGYLYGKPLGYEGGTIPMALNTAVSFIALGAGLLILPVSRDMRGRREAEKEKEDTTRFLDSIIENIPNMVFVKDAETLRFVRFNKYGEALLGIDRKALIGKSDFDLFPKDEAEFFTAKDREVLASGRLLDIPEEQIQTAGQGGRYLHTRKIPILGHDGKPKYLLGISEDITDKKTVSDEIDRLNEALQKRVEDLQALNDEIEAFSYSVSHDLRAPLRHISGFSDLLIKSKSVEALDETGRRYVKTISDSARHMGELIDNLLSFSRMGRAAMTKSRVSMNALVQEALSDLRAESEGRRVAWTIPPLPDVHGDPSMLRLVLTNLFSNALKYTRKQPQAEIEVACRPGPEGDWVFSVRDNGAGFDMKYADKLFGVFQRLHSSDDFEGTGIGLANVRRIVFRHGGRTWAEGVPDGGAVFYFSLPQGEKSA